MRRGKFGPSVVKSPEIRTLSLAVIDLPHLNGYPKHSSWLNQIEIWLSILVRKLLKRGSFRSVADLQRQILAFIEYYNATMAKPFAWTYQGKALTA